MTVFLPLEASTPVPHSPPFLIQADDPQTHISRAIKAIMKAKRIVVICGAGVSVQAGIPDFRSSEGLFKKRDNPREALVSGKDLFDASVFNSEHTTSLFCQMIARLSELSQAAQPTPFHNILRALDDRGKLLRVYTQNIDAIEEKCGLSFGVPEYEDKRSKPRSKTPAPPISKQDSSDSITSSKPSWLAGQPPRCIPLHGTLQMLHCQICMHNFPLEDYLPSLHAGLPPHCPECTSIEETRQLIGKRSRAIGRLRPSVVLYNEAHKNGEGVGEVVRKDLMGSSKGKGRSGADLLLVVGTSLRVPGTKRMVREFAKAVRSRRMASPSASTSALNPLSSTFLSHRSPSADDEQTMKALYLNLDFPVPTREWDGVFDAWIQGDAQDFARQLQDEIDKERKMKELAIEKKRRRDELALAAQNALLSEGESSSSEKPSSKRKTSALTPPRPTKRQKHSFPPSPPKTPSVDSDSCISTPQSTPPKLFIRIPARRPRPRLIPEVVITKLASHHPRKPPQLPGMAHFLPTPERSPVTSSAKHAIVTGTNSRPGPPAAISAFASDDDTLSEEDDEMRVLPQTLVRNVQFGLRGSGGCTLLPS